MGHRQHIFGKHVANYMDHLIEEDEEAYKKQFAHYIKNGIASNLIESMYSKAHAAIRKDPDRAKKPEKKVTKKKVVSQENILRREESQGGQEQGRFLISN